MPRQPADGRAQSTMRAESHQGASGLKAEAEERLRRVAGCSPARPGLFGRPNGERARTGLPLVLAPFFCRAFLSVSDSIRYFFLTLFFCSSVRPCRVLLSISYCAYRVFRFMMMMMIMIE